MPINIRYPLSPVLQDVCLAQQLCDDLMWNLKKKEESNDDSGYSISGMWGESIIREVVDSLNGSLLFSDVYSVSVHRHVRTGIVLKSITVSKNTNN